MKTSQHCPLSSPSFPKKNNTRKDTPARLQSSCHVQICPSKLYSIFKIHVPHPRKQRLLSHNKMQTDKRITSVCPTGMKPTREKWNRDPNSYATLKNQWDF
jgi:hypothetical protein